MTISVTDTALDLERKAMKHYARRNRLHILLTWIYCGLFLMSSMGFYVFWYTDVFSNYVLSNMKLTNGSRTFDWWQQPPVKLEYRIRVFNYTNVKEFEAGKVNKLRVQELGPYTYRETKSRVNVVMHENGTVTFQEERSFEYIGGRPEDDVVVVPNVPLMFVTAFVRDTSFMTRMGTNVMLAGFQEQTYVNVTVSDFLWGYEITFLKWLKPFMKQDIPLEKFGLMAAKKLNKNRITMSTGVPSLDNLGMIERLNGMDNRKMWGDEKCDRIMGTDGSMFPPHLIKNTNNPLYVYSQDMCRNLPFYFAEEVTTYGIPSLRYKLSPDAFNSSRKENKCFCPKVDGSRVCPPDGLFNISACVFGTPLLTSFPHFYGADKSLLKQIDGLNPRQEDHESYVDVHPRLATPMAGWSRFQMNLEVRTAISVPFLGKLKDGTILPIMWVEIGTDQIPEFMLETLQSAYFTAGNVEMALQWGSFIAMILSFSALVTCLWKYLVQWDEIFPEKLSG
ncbi:lysosome membrane protein 2-like [Nylanderia fulva]|uniref:lysosome membrane protein 2-like n=1 Tax=Nylanderia fulva TaxID=613905 RepID=UPI0010FB9F0E|nr:lysosome membrane protein 2-like [Nylanderia fulva]